MIFPQTQAFSCKALDHLPLFQQTLLLTGINCTLHPCFSRLLSSPDHLYLSSIRHSLPASSFRQSPISALLFKKKSSSIITSFLLPAIASSYTSPYSHSIFSLPLASSSRSVLQLSLMLIPAPLFIPPKCSCFQHFIIASRLASRDRCVRHRSSFFIVFLTLP